MQSKSVLLNLITAAASYMQDGEQRPLNHAINEAYRHAQSLPDAPAPSGVPLVNEKAVHPFDLFLGGQEMKGQPLTKEEAKAAYDFLVRLSYRIRHAEPQNVEGRNTQSYYVCSAIGDVRDYLVQVGVSDITELHDFTKEVE